MNYTVISNYLTYCKINKRLSEHTIRAYKNDLNQFYSFRNSNVMDYIDHLTKTMIKTSTLKRKIACLKVFYRYLELENIIEENPFLHLRFKFRPEKSLPKTISIRDLKKIHSYLKEKFNTSHSAYQKQKAKRNLLIVSLLLSTGIRISELCHIMIENIHLSDRCIHILGKGNKERIIYLGDLSTYRLLKNYITTYCKVTDVYLFSGNKLNSSLSEQTVRLLLKNVSKKIRLDKAITPHMFRHSFATMLLDSNVDIRYIQHILGHSSINVTQIYTHVSQHKQQEILSFCNPITSILSDK